MASSRVATSQPQAAAGSADLPRFASGSGIGSMNMDDIMRNIYGDAPPPPDAAVTGAGGPTAPVPAPGAARRTSEEVWKEISAAGGLSAPPPPLPPPAVVAAVGGCGGAAEMTLEDFLARDTGAARAPPPMVAVEGAVALGFPDGGDVAAGPGAGGRARKRAMMDPTDRAVVQRQKRMIKNRESAARSRDRKQAYVAELESQVSQLEEEQAELLREQVEQNQKRLKELLEKPVPVIRKKPLQDHRRTNSMEW